MSTPHCQIVRGDSNQPNPLSLLCCPPQMTGPSSLRRERKLESISLTFVRHLTLSLTSHYLLNFVNMDSLSHHQVDTCIISYLANHKQSVVVNGDVYGIADVNLSDGSKIVLYADGILLYCPILLSIHLKHLQKDVDDYAIANYLTFNVPEYKFMLVSRKKQSTNFHPSISVMDPTTTFKHLGLIKASHLSWSTHIITFAPRQNAFWDCMGTDVFTSTQT